MSQQPYGQSNEFRNSSRDTANGHVSATEGPSQAPATSTAPAVQQQNRLTGPGNEDIDGPLTMNTMEAHLTAIQAQVQLVDNQMLVLGAYRNAIERTLTDHGLNRVHLPVVNDGPMPQLPFLGVAIDMTAIANGGAFPGAGRPDARPYYLTSTLVDALILSVQRVSSQVQTISGQVSEIINRNYTIDTRLNQLTALLNRVRAEEMNDRLRSSTTAHRDQGRSSNTLQRDITRQITNSVAGLRQETGSVRVQQQGRSNNQSSLQNTSQALPQTQTMSSIVPASTASMTAAVPAPQTSPAPSESSDLMTMSPNTKQPRSGPTPTVPATGSTLIRQASSPFNPLAEAFQPAVTPRHPQRPEPAEEDDQLPEIPASEIATAFTTAFAIATDGMHLKTTEQSKFAPKPAATAAADPAISDSKRAQAFRERIEKRGIKLTDPCGEAAASAGQGVDTSAYASLDMFEKAYGEDGKAGPRAEVVEEKKKKKKNGGLATGMAGMLEGYETFLEKYKKRM